MAKAKLEGIDLLVGISAVIASIAVGELLISGAVLGGVILGTLPIIIHQIAGWTIILTGVLALVRMFGFMK